MTIEFLESCLNNFVHIFILLSNSICITKLNQIVICMAFTIDSLAADIKWSKLIYIE